MSRRGDTAAPSLSPATLLAAGTVGSVLLVVGGLGVGAVPPGDRVEALSTVGGPVCLVGGVLLLAAWWLARGLDRRSLLLATGLWSSPLLLGPPLMSRDLYAYVGQGALVAAGVDPYENGPGTLPGPLSAGVDDVWIDTPSPYGPLWLASSGLVVRLTGQHLLPALLLTRLLSALGVVLLAWALPRIAAAHRVPAGRALWLGVANPLLLVHLVGGGHNDALMVGLLAAGVAVCAPAPGGPPVRVGARLALAAALVTLAALVKVPAIVALGFLPLLLAASWGTRARAAAVVAAASAATAFVVSLTTGLGWGWLGTLDAGRARLSLFSPLTGLGLALPGGDATLDAVLGLGLVAAALCCTAALALAAGSRVAPVPALGAALVATSLLLPVVQPWYVLWGVTLLAACVPARQAVALGGLCLVLAVLVAPSGRNLVRPPLYGVPSLLAVGAAVALYAQGRSAAAAVEVS